jgi:AraC-like DNA-binding protein
MTGSLTTAQNAAHHRVTPRRFSKLELVRKIESYLIEAGNRRIHISEICESFKVHPRKLHRAFNAVTGVPPMTYLRHKRLGEVHTALLTAGPGVKVCDVARAHGFIDLSLFAAAYRRQFGELPSQTLRRAPDNLISRETTTGSTTTVYDASGRNVGTGSN